MHRIRLIAALTALFLLVGVIGCTQQKAGTPSYEEAVKSSLQNAGFKDVKVEENREKGVITLNGSVRTEEEKRAAEEAAKAAAPGVVVANQISIEPEGF